MSSGSAIAKPAAKMVRAKIAKLRAKAGMAYIAHPEGISIEELHRRAEFAKVSLRTLERWASQDRWVEERQKYIQDWTRKARERLGNHIAQERIGDLNLLAEIRDRGLAKLREDLVAPKSYEGLMKATKDVVEFMDTLRQAIGDDVIIKTAAEARGLPQVTNMTEIDAAEAAKAALAARRAMMRKRLTAAPQETPSASSNMTPDVPMSDEVVIEDLHAVGAPEDQ